MKALKFLGIILLAGTMMCVSCKKDEPKPDDNTTENPGGGDNPGGGGGQTTSDGVTIAFNGTSWLAANMEAVDHTDQNYLTLYVEKTTGCSGDYSDIFLNGFMESVVCENETYESTSGDVMNYRDPNYIYTDNDGVLGDAGGQYWGWNVNPSTFVETITAVDLNALTMSATFSEEIFDIADYIAAGGSVPSNTITLNGTMQNASWAWASKKAADSKKMSANLVERVK